MMELSSYKCDFPSTCCEQVFNKILNEEVIETISMCQSSPEWHKARKFRITGSRCYEIFTYCGTDWEMKSKKYFWPKSFTNKFVRHGLKYENMARTSFITKTGETVVECGMITSSANKWLGFSADGVVLNNGQPTALLEIKCLYAGKYSKMHR